MSNNKEELVVKVKPGTKVRIVESVKDEDLKQRDFHVTVPQSLKISVSRVQGKGFEGSPSTITMCG
ncbi:hypothetical protein [Wocania ichthyoenteri]|uniref:hypothetical protein n=1 Tax=Wocania ichthyoenteri TaxID=1230531 RepID=UPI00053D4908|nr:hypothetical protein [Wocania ichthyoenteri]